MRLTLHCLQHTHSFSGRIRTCKTWITSLNYASIVHDVHDVHDGHAAVADLFSGVWSVTLTDSPIASASPIAIGGITFTISPPSQSHRVTDSQLCAHRLTAQSQSQMTQKPARHAMWRHLSKSSGFYHGTELLKDAARPIDRLNFPNSPPLNATDLKF